MAYYLRWGSGILGVEGGPPEKYQYFSYGAFSEFEQREYFQYRIRTNWAIARDLYSMVARVQ